MAAGLVGQGADRVLAMLAPVTDRYATLLAAACTRSWPCTPPVPAGVALARARAEADAAVRWNRQPGQAVRGPRAGAGVRGGDAAGRRR